MYRSKRLIAIGWLLLAGCCALTACVNLKEQGTSQTALQHVAATPAAKQALAPQGVLKVGVYLGSPTSLVRDQKTGASHGVAFELGHLLGGQLGVPVQVVQFQRVAEVIDALKVGQIDMTFTNATAVRSKEVDFTPSLIQLELGILVPNSSAIQRFEDVDKSGVRLGVSQGSSSQGVLGQRLKHAAIIPVASLTEVQKMLSQHQLDAFATNKGILFELAEKTGETRVLDDKWGVENLAIAIPKGREQGMPYLLDFAQRVQQTGLVHQIATRAGLRGMLNVH